jgi:hypothetical protein
MKAATGLTSISPSLPSPKLPIDTELLNLSRRERPGPVTDLIIFPEEQEEWEIVMEEVKKLYVNRQYKQCSARCIQILENIKDPVCNFHFQS